MRKTVLVLFFISVVLLLSASSNATPVPLADDQIVIKGNIYYWNLLETGGVVLCDNKDFSEIAGGMYYPLRRTYVEAEFFTLAGDPSTYTDESGYFYLKKGGLSKGSKQFNLEVRAKTILDTRQMLLGSRDTVASIFDSSLAFYTRSLETPTYTAQTGETITLNLYLGGPKNNVLSGNSDAFDVLGSLWLAQDLRSFYSDIIRKAPTSSDLSWDSYIIYPGKSGAYTPFGLPFTGHLSLKETPLYPSQVTQKNGFCVDHMITKGWRDLQGTLRHEYSHQVMHNIYGSLPVKDTGSHAPSGCIDAQVGWVEGWANFLPAAMANWPTSKGVRGYEHLEYNYNPYTQADMIIGEPFNPAYPPDKGLGNITWHRTVLSSCDSPQFSEGEVAAVLWDIYDPKGWEYLDRVYQPAEPDTGMSVRPPEGWMRPLGWYDALEDGDLSLIWTVLKKKPQSLTGNRSADKPSFVKLWNDQYHTSGDLIHGLKAILFNRGITTEPWQENPPVIENLALDVGNRKLTFDVSDPDPEDRDHLYYNVCYRKSTGQDCEYFFVEDQPLGPLSAGANAVEVSIPPGKLGRQMIVLVHDSMLPVFQSVTYGPQQIEGSLNRIRNLSTSYATGVVVDGEYAYMTDMEDGLYIFDLTDPLQPRQVALLGADRSSDTGWSGAMDLQIRGSKAFLAAYSGALVVVDISNPLNPLVENVIELEGGPQAVAVDGSRIYVACGNAGLAVVDLSEPRNKVWGYVDVQGEALDVAVGSSWVYAATGRDGLKVVGRGRVPMLVGGRRVYGIGEVKFVAVDASGLVYASGDRLEILDFSKWSPGQHNLQFFTSAEVDPGKALPAKLFSIEQSLPGRMIFDGALLYAVAGWQVDMYDISIPELAYLAVSSDPFQPVDVAPYGDEVYVAAGKYGLVVLSRTDEAQDGGLHPVLLEWLGEFSNFRVQDMEFFGNTGYIATRNDGLNVIDISNPSGIAIRDKFGEQLDINHPNYAAGVELKEGMIYVAFDDGVIDILAPRDEFWVDSVANVDLTRYGSQLDSLELEGDFAYMCAGSDGVMLVYIREKAPEGWVTIYSHDLTDCTATVASEEVAYVLGRQSGLHVFDMEFKRYFNRVGGWSLPFSFSGNHYSTIELDEERQLLYVTVENQGLYILDVSNPLKPKETGVFRCDSGLGLALDGEIAYVGDAEVIHIVDVSDPTNPFEIGSVALSEIPAYEVVARVLKMHGDLLFVGTDRQSLIVYRRHFFNAQGE